jgi:preprotein translocase subunit YajC
MLAALILFAQETAPDVKDPSGAPPFASMLPLLLIVGAFFLLIILPAQRKEKKQREMLMTNLKKNDEVLTTSGIIGIVQNIRPEEDEVTIKIDDNCKVRMKKSSIAQILKTKEEPPAAK